MELFKIKQIRFLITGSIGALVNLFLIYLFVNKLKMSSFLMKNYANMISLELSIIFSFAINRNWTWNHRIKDSKYSLLRQVIYFHIAVSFSVILRIILFPLCQLIEINYLINTGVGISLGAILNYFAFDRLIFVKKHSNIMEETK